MINSDGFMHDSLSAMGLVNFDMKSYFVGKVHHTMCRFLRVLQFRIWEDSIIGKTLVIKE